MLQKFPNEACFLIQSKNCFYSKTYKAEKKAFDETYKELYPNTHKMRDKLLKNESVQYYVGF